MHVVPVADAAPTLISNGFDEAVQFHLSDDFVINAEEDGEVVEVNPDVGLMTVKYKSGKTKTISLKPDIIKNSNSNFYTSNTYKFTHDKVGEKFKKDEPLAYNDKFFNYSKLNGLRYSIGPLTKVAFMSTYNTYEDAGITTEKFNERMKTTITIKDDATFKKTDIILDMVKVGDHVNIGDPLVKFEESVDDDILAGMLSKMNDETADVIESETKGQIKATAAGKIIDIKVSTLVDPSDLSPSLKKIVQGYFNKGKKKIAYLNKYDKEGTIYKSGYLMTDDTEPTKNRYNQLKGYKNIDVLVEFFIEHDDVMKVGDKIAVYGPNKEIISEVVPKGFEPYSEFRPDEDIEVLTSPGTISRRMTIGIVPIMGANKVLIELKRKIADIAKFSS